MAIVRSLGRIKGNGRRFLLLLFAHFPPVRNSAYLILAFVLSVGAGSRRRGLRRFGPGGSDLSGADLGGSDFSATSV